jgi:hypothetical protein
VVEIRHGTFFQNGKPVAQTPMIKPDDSVSDSDSDYSDDADTFSNYRAVNLPGNELVKSILLAIAKVDKVFILDESYASREAREGSKKLLAEWEKKGLVEKISKMNK